MKLKLLTSLLVIMTTMFSLSAQNTVSVLGFGEIPYVKNTNDFTVEFKKFGSFDFTGTIQPLSLETTVAIERLNKIPGYRILKELELSEAILKLSSDGFEIEARADTKKKLKTLCEALKIEAPFILIGAKISPSSFELSGGLDFTEKPIIIDVNKDVGTRMILEKLSLGAEVEADGGVEATLSVKNEILLRPSLYDPDLKTVLELSFNLVNLELSGACSMTDEWQDPLGISYYVGTKKTDIIVGNTAAAVGWVVGSPTPTTLGFAAGRAKFFDMDFGAMMSISPASGELALKAYSKRISMKQFENTLRNGFGLDVPDVMPASNDVYVDDTQILFAPNGGEVGEVEIEKGFAMKGGVKFSSLMEGSLDFYANFNDGFYLDMYMNAEQMYRLLEREVRKQPDAKMRQAMETAMNTMQIKEIHLHLSAERNLNMSGASKAQLVLFGNDINFDLKGTFSPEKVVDQIINEIGSKALAHVERIGKEVVKVAGAAANASINTARAGYDKLGYYAQHSVTWKDHATHGARVPIKNTLIAPSCKDKCVPNRAKKLSSPVYESSNKAVRDFYNKVNPKLADVPGRSLREKYIKADWNRLISSIDANWEKIIHDDLYLGFDKDPSDAARLGDQYRKLVRAKKQEHVNYRNDLWNELITEKHFIFFVDGSAEIYQVSNNGGLGPKVNEVRGTWRTDWSEIEYYRAGGKDMMLFYQQAGGGFAAMYEKGENGGLGRKVATTKNWKATWTDIEYYQAGGQDMMLFYEQAGGGNAALYKLKTDGTLGARVALINNWRATWTDIEYYRAGGKDMMLFYQQAGGGYAEMYEIKSDGTLGSQVATTKNWRATWTDIEYYRAGGRDMLLFYQQSTGYAAMYEVANNGGLGRKVHETSGWRKTWTEIEFY